MTISTVVDPVGQIASLVDTLLAPGSGISVVAGSVSLALSGPGAVNQFDAGTGAALGLGAGLLLTSGSTPGTGNTLTWFGSDNSASSGFANGDADIDAVVNTVFQTQSYDATCLSFDFTVSDPAFTSISFDLVFGSEEYPEWVDAFVDCAVVIVDGVNYALFNKNPNAPLSVISPNLAAGYFQDNASGAIPIEYDGVSGKLRIVAPLASGRSVHTIKIGIADTGDHILDSGLFISGLAAGTDPGSGVVSDPGGGSSGDDNCSGSSKDEYFNLLAGNDTVYAAGGADIIVAGSGNDKVYGGSGDDEIKGDGGDDLLDGGADLDTAVYGGLSGDYQISYDAQSDHYSINGSAQGEGVDTLVSIEQLKFGDGLFALGPTGLSAVITNPPPPPPANVSGEVVITDALGNALSGPAALGATLMASVSDPDGCSGTIAYQWFSDGVALTGETAASYGLQESDTGHFLSVSVSYTDDLGFQENHSSQSLLALPDNGDLLLTLMTVEGPAAAAVNTPITTLLLRAIDLGETPNTAIQKIRSALNVPAQVGSLLSTNAFKILQSGSDPQALALAKLEAQVAILCSSSADQSGINLTQVLLDYAANGQAFNVADPADLALIPGITAEAIDVVSRRNSNIQRATSLLGTGDSIENEWLDFISNWDLTLDLLPLDILSHAINQAPQGLPDATLPHLQAEQQQFTLTDALLLEGVQDPDGDALTIQWLSTDHGDWFVPDSAAAGWSLDVAANGYDPAYVGPLELTYGVDDGHGHTIIVSQMLVVDPLNHLPSGDVTITVQGGGAVAQNAVLVAANSLSDADGLSGPISYSWYAGSTLLGQGATLTLGQPHVGQSLQVVASYSDDQGTAEAVSSAVSGPVANVDDLPTGSVTVTAGNPPKLGDTLTASHSVSDLDGIPSTGVGAIGLQWQSSADGSSWSDIANASGASLLVGTGLLGLRLRAQVRYVDLFGTANSVSSEATAAVIPVGVLWTGTSNADTKAGTAYQDSLNGVGGTDSLVGLAGDDRLDGGAGIDTLVGGLGNDTYLVDSASDLITELLAEGDDTVLASATYSLLAKAANVESLTLSGTSAINGTGNALNNTLTGNSAANVLDGGAGNDTLIGGAGNDTYVVDNAADWIAELAAGGLDLVQSSLTLSLAAFAEVENLTLTGTAAINASGNALDNTLSGNGAANVLDGGAGNDTLLGGAGTDSLLGLSGDDRLDGGAGIDTLVGGLGNDTYLVDSASDLITELLAEGDDTVLASATYSLLAKAANVESLTLSGTSAINGTGNALNNTLTGNSAANVLDGGAGNDTLIGGAGNDTYGVDSAGDLVQEAAAAGTDLVQASISFSLASLTNLENLTLTGTAAIQGSGNGLANVLTGNGAANLLQGGAGADSFSGGAGNDTLDGGLGADQLAGGSGADVFRFDTALELVNSLAVTDKITDFTTSQADRIELSHQVFTALTGAAVSNGALSSAAFLSSSTGAATNASQRILYNSTTGLLSYDSDGNGLAAAYGFAQLTTLPALTSSMILVSGVLPSV